VVAVKPSTVVVIHSKPGQTAKFYNSWMYFFGSYIFFAAIKLRFAPAKAFGALKQLKQWFALFIGMIIITFLNLKLIRMYY